MSTSSSNHKIQWAKIYKGFFEEPARYRVLYGGRGSSKSWTVAQSLVIRAMEKPRLILCARELQKSIRDSSHRLIANTIERLGFSEQFEVGESFIRCKNGTEFIFKGLKYNADEIKSTEGIDICWVEEADRITKRSLQLLIPTVRNPNSEIWFTFNPNDEDDEVYQRFVINETPPNSKVLKVNWHDNPWFSEELEKERLWTKENNPDEYSHIWEGECQKALEGAYYAKALAELRDNGGITEVPYNVEFLVDTYWDIGMSDYTSVWFVQKIGFRYHVIDFMQHNNEDLPFYADEIKNRKYRYRSHYLPHDAGHLRLGMGGRTVQEQLEQLLPNNEFIKLPPSGSIISDVAATKAFIARCAFDEDKCKEGLRALKRYSAKWNDQKNKYEDKPYHNEFSHAADAFRYFAMHQADERDMAREHNYKDLDNDYNQTYGGNDNDFEHSYI